MAETVVVGGFRPREVIPGIPEEAQRELYAMQQDILRALQGSRGGRTTDIKTSDYFARAYEIVRVQVPATGLAVVLPDARAVPDGAWIEVLTEQTAGTLIVMATDGETNAALEVTSTVVGRLRFVSNRSDGWLASSFLNGSVGNAQLAPMPGLTVKLNPSFLEGPAQDYSLDALTGAGITLFGVSGSPRFVINGWDRGRTGFYDDFRYVQAATVTTEPWMGDTPWRFAILSGTVSVASAAAISASHPGSARFSMSANSSFAISKSFNERISNIARFEWIVRPVTTLTGLRFELGLANGATPDAAARSAHFRFAQAADTTVHCITRTGSAETSDTDSNVVQALNAWNVFGWESPGSTLDPLTFYIDDVVVATVAAATHGISFTDTFGITLFASTGASAAAIDVDFVVHESGAMSRTI